MYICYALASIDWSNPNGFSFIDERTEYVQMSALHKVLLQTHVD